ncbi:MAG: choice-of-anchor B family protein [Saprospiraceae bacterium]|nr:choice-of-anchor B family protein [Saprospiraceae bacterium]MBK7811190.1 choice-of-anchor B family protein [Saprospiraceae bacterium]MBK9631106.1 choice-of-anchor B family protein [Saprospiraceae bacterium]
MSFTNIKFLIYFSIFGISGLFGQNSQHVDLLSHVLIPENSSSIWGYTNPDGIELALLGTFDGVRIYDISNPSQPVEKIFIQNNPCSWRELKTSGSFAYVGSECNAGLLIIDLTNPDDIKFQNLFKIADTKGDSFDVFTSHTLYSDEEGFIYLSGARSVGAGFAILDPSVDPWHPTLIYHFEDDYMHEVHVKDGFLYGAELFKGEFSIWDLKDKSAPLKIASQKTAYSFTHSVWIEEGRKVLYTADEVTGAVVEAWDVEDPLDIKKLDQYRVYNPEDPYHIPHNVFHKDSFLYVSWYTEGMRVLDTRRPHNLVEVGYYDTHPDKRTGFNGCWSVFPYYKSGVIVASDIQYGMFVFKFDGNKAGWLEGEVRDSASSQNLSRVQIQLKEKSSGKITFLESNQRGEYSTGSSESGIFEISLSLEAYHPKTIEVELFKDSIISLDIEMVARAKADARFEVVDEIQNQAIGEAIVTMYNDLSKFEGYTNENPDVNCIIPNVYLDRYDLLCTKWGYLYELMPDVDFDGNSKVKFEMTPGYEDHFMTQLGWEIVKEDSLINWIYGDFSELDPPPSNYPSKDVPNDIGNLALYTDNFDKVEESFRLNGHMYLISPPMYLKNFDKIQISYNAWAYGGWDNSIKETLLIFGNDTVKLEDMPFNLGGDFNPRTVMDLDIQGKSRDSVRFIFHLWNDPDSSHLAIAVRAALDYFTVTGLILNNSENNVENSDLKLYPNPITDQLYISNPSGNVGQVSIHDFNGKLLESVKLQAGEISNFDFSKYASGLYFYQWSDATGRKSVGGKFIKL